MPTSYLRKGNLLFAVFHFQRRHRQHFDLHILSFINISHFSVLFLRNTFHVLLPIIALAFTSMVYILSLLPFWVDRISIFLKYVLSRRACRCEYSFTTVRIHVLFGACDIIINNCVL